MLPKPAREAVVNQALGWRLESRPLDGRFGLGNESASQSCQSARAERTSEARSKAGQSLLLGVFDVKQLVQARDRKDLVNFRLQIAQTHFAGMSFHLLVENDQLVEGGRRKKLDAGKIDQQVFPRFFLDQ